MSEDRSVATLRASATLLPTTQITLQMRTANGPREEESNRIVIHRISRQVATVVSDLCRIGCVNFATQQASTQGKWRL